jgi:hypothetical protein
MFIKMHLKHSLKHSQFGEYVTSVYEMKSGILKKVIPLIIRVKFSFLPARGMKLFLPLFLGRTSHLFFFGCINKEALGYLQASFF